MVIIFWVVGVFAMIMVATGIFVAIRVVKMIVVVYMAVGTVLNEVCSEAAVSNFNVEGIAVEDLIVEIVNVIGDVTGLLVIESIVAIAVVV